MGFKYYSDMKDSNLSELSRQSNIKTDNQLIIFSDYNIKDCPETGRSTREYIISHKVGPIDHGTHVPGTVAQSSV